MRELDECGVCGGPGIVAPACDWRATLKTNAAFVADLALRIRSATDGNEDECGVCGGDGSTWRKAAPTRGVHDPGRLWTTVHVRRVRRMRRSGIVLRPATRQREDECGICGGPD